MKRVTNDGLSGILSTSNNTINFKRDDILKDFGNINYKIKRVIKPNR